MTRTLAVLLLAAAFGCVPLARAGFFLRDSVPDLFDLGASRGARLAFTAPDDGSSTYNIDVAAGAWADFTEVAASGPGAASGIFGLVAELHRATPRQRPVNTRRLTAAAWTIFGGDRFYVPTSEGVAWQRDVVRGISSYQGFFKASLVVPRQPGAARISPLHALIWSTSYAPVGRGTFLAAGAPAIGVNYQSADSGATGHVVRARAEYSASLIGGQGRLENLSLDAGWIYQRRIGGSGTFGSSDRVSHRLRVSLAYAVADGVALVAERIEGEDPFEASGDDAFTSLSLRVRFGAGPAAR